MLQFPTASSKLWLNYSAAEDKLSAGKIGKLIAYKLQVGMSSSGVLKLTQHFRCSVSVLNLHTFLIQNHHYAHCRPLRPLSLSAKSIIVLFFFVANLYFRLFGPNLDCAVTENPLSLGLKIKQVELI